MTTFPYVVLACMLAGPLASMTRGQAPPALSITVDRLPVVHPLQGTAVANFTIDASCLMIQPGQPTVSGQVKIASKPEWAAVIASPASFVVDARSCGSARTVEIRGQVAASVGQDAPAGRPGALLLEASTDGVPSGNASAEVPIVAAYLGKLDVQVAEAIATVRPGESHTFSLKLSNFGNDDTIVRAAVVDLSGGVHGPAHPRHSSCKQTTRR